MVLTPPTMKIEGTYKVNIEQTVRKLGE